MRRKQTNPTVSSLVSGLCLLLLAGCGSDSQQRHSLEGTVTLDGQPLASGAITFRPLAGTDGPSAGGKVTDGRFSVQPEGGTFVGKFRVEITASRKSGKQEKDYRTGKPMDIIEQYLPPRYNSQSELTAEVTAEGLVAVQSTKSNAKAETAA